MRDVFSSERKFFATLSTAKPGTKNVNIDMHLDGHLKRGREAQPLKECQEDIHV